MYEDLSGGIIDTLVFHNHAELVNVVHIVGTVGLVVAMAQMRIARTNILSAVAHMSRGKMENIIW